MATALERFRDHCRRMAESTPDTRIRAQWGTSPSREPETTLPVGPISDADRMLWARMAAEATAFIERDPDADVESDVSAEEVPLF